MSQVLVLFMQRAFGDESCAPRLQTFGGAMWAASIDGLFRPVDLSPASA